MTFYNVASLSSATLSLPPSLLLPLAPLYILHQHHPCVTTQEVISQAVRSMMWERGMQIRWLVLQLLLWIKRWL